ncbi:Bug family tripartite tricarboxylate transporter substrate binding protein [Tardiphaga alba]|nr:tripartite tricarboxylate transporter substrate binding protein [Tardiphaga alba]
MTTTALLTRRRLMTASAGAAALLCAPSLVRANSWPTKPIRILAGFAAGGQTDQFSRAYGDYISREVGQTVVVENKTGAGGALAAVELKRSAPDGHTLMITNTTTFMLNPVLMKDIRYDPLKDFAMISMMPSGSVPLFVSEKVPAKTLAEFIDYAKKSGKVNIGTYAAGSYAHIVVAELNKQYGLKMEAIHYRGEAPMFADLAGQAIDAGIGTYVSAMPLLDAGKIKTIATSRRRIPSLPDVATFKEQGMTSRATELMTFQGCVAPTGTPQEIVTKLSELMVAAGKTDRIQEMLKKQGIDEAAMTVAASQKIYKEEAPVWAELAGSLGPVAQ